MNMSSVIGFIECLIIVIVFIGIYFGRLLILRKKYPDEPFGMYVANAGILAIGVAFGGLFLYLMITTTKTVNSYEVVRTDAEMVYVDESGKKFSLSDKDLENVKFVETPYAYCEVTVGKRYGYEMTRSVQVYLPITIFNEVEG